MSVPKPILDAKGAWHGSSKLHMSWLPEGERISESESDLLVEQDFQSSHAIIRYYWMHDGIRQEGTLLVAGNADASEVQMAWSDSWHQDSGVLSLIGGPIENGVKAKGSYTAGDETWGWTIALCLVADDIQLEMENVTPAGEAEWAVKAIYARMLT